MKREARMGMQRRMGSSSEFSWLPAQTVNCCRDRDRVRADAFHFGKSWYTPPCFSERVRNGLKAKSLEGKIWCTENGRVRKSMKTKGNSVAEDLDLARRALSSRKDRGGKVGLGEFGRGHKGDGEMPNGRPFL